MSVCSNNYENRIVAAIPNHERVGVPFCSDFGNHRITAAPMLGRWYMRGLSRFYMPGFSRFVRYAGDNRNGSRAERGRVGGSCIHPKWPAGSLNVLGGSTRTPYLCASREIPCQSQAPRLQGAMICGMNVSTGTRQRPRSHMP